MQYFTVSDCWESQRIVKWNQGKIVNITKGFYMLNKYLFTVHVLKILNLPEYNVEVSLLIYLYGIFKVYIVSKAWGVWCIIDVFIVCLQEKHKDYDFENRLVVRVNNALKQLKAWPLILVWKPDLSSSSEKLTYRPRLKAWPLILV